MRHCLKFSLNIIQSIQCANSLALSYICFFFFYWDFLWPEICYQNQTVCNQFYPCIGMMRKLMREEGGRRSKGIGWISVCCPQKSPPLLCAYYAFKSAAVPHCFHSKECCALTLPHCALERAPDQTLRFGSGKHFSLPPTCANCAILLNFFLFTQQCNPQIFGKLGFFELVIKGHLPTTTASQLEWMLVKSEICAKCDCCHDFTAHNLREP